jgi:isopenicillin N synthase-like dioxygenase
MTVVASVDLQSADAVSQLDRALEASGFVQLHGHGLDAAVVAELRSRCDDFFALAVEDKRRFVHPSPEANRGYRAKGAEALSYSLGTPSPPDLFESFNCGSDDRVDGSSLMRATPWPDDLVPGFSAAVHAHLAHMERISETLDRFIGSILGFDLAGQSMGGPDTLACIDYKPQPDGTEPTLDGQQRMGAHSDYTSFTILLADEVRGLQIVGSRDEWIDVIPEPGALLMNVGDVLAMYTNDRWPSTLHRVVPMVDGCAPNRRSVAYFHYPDAAVTVTPLDGRSPRYEPVTVRDHLLGKLTAPKTSEPATGASTAAGRLSTTQPENNNQRPATE